MSEMAPEPGGASGGGIMSHTIMGIPTILWVGIVALVVYFLFFRNSGAGSPTTGGGGGTATENVTLNKGAVTIDIHANPQPKPPVHRRKGTHHTHQNPVTQKTHPPTPPRKKPPVKKPAVKKPPVKKV